MTDLMSDLLEHPGAGQIQTIERHGSLGAEVHAGRPVQLRSHLAYPGVAFRRKIRVTAIEDDRAHSQHTQQKDGLHPRVAAHPPSLKREQSAPKDSY